MIDRLYSLAIRYPKSTIAMVLGVTIYFAMLLPQLRWETDARVYLPKGHPAIKYDERVDEIFGVKDSVIIGIVNEQKGIFNPDTLARIARITDKVAALPGVIANRPIDVASLSTATVFVGTESSIGSEPLMTHIPDNSSEIARLKEKVYANSDILVGNLVSADGKAAMIRAKLKEGINTRYKTYFEIKCQILPQETGDWSAMQECSSAGGSDWQEKKDSRVGLQQYGGGQASWRQGDNSWKQWQQGNGASTSGKLVEGEAQNGDKIYLAGRPVIEVTSGMSAIKDMRVMIPLLLIAIAFTLLVIFRTARGVVLPLFVMGAAIVWTMGAMVLLDVPLYTISTMLPVILVAVSIGDSVHLLTHYYDNVVQDAHRPGGKIVTEVMASLGRPLVTTSITTAVGFLALLFAEMPPFIIFGLFTVLGIFFSWFLTVTFIPAALTILRPKVSGYLAKRRSLRVHSEQSRLTVFLVRCGEWIHGNKRGVLAALIAVMVLSAIGASRLYVDSSWMSDFKKDSDLVAANNIFNNEFDGTIYMNVVVEGNKKNILKSPNLLRHIEDLQKYVDHLPYVGGSRSIVDYIKNMNQTLHAGNREFDVIPDNADQIGEYLFLLSISGRPQQLDEMVDYDYRQGLITFAIKTDHTQVLRDIIDKTKRYIANEFGGVNVKLNFAGSANNSYVWANLLIGSQTSSILLSKVTILVIATIMFGSLWLGIITVIPLIFTTLLIAGVAGYLAIPLDVSTALAAGVAIGVGVDYAVHYIFRYRAELARSGDKLSATEATMRSVGRTIVFNASVVIIGFSVLLISQFPPHVKLGYFVVAYMAVSCIASLVLLPALFAFSRSPSS